MFDCVGGGGLLTGIAAYIKSIRPDVLVIGVEANDAAGMLSEAKRDYIHFISFFFKKWGFEKSYHFTVFYLKL